MGQGAVGVFADGDLGDLERQTRVLAIGDGALGGDLLVDQIFVERRMVEFGDLLTLLDRRAFG